MPEEIGGYAKPFFKVVSESCVGSFVFFEAYFAVFFLVGYGFLFEAAWPVSEVPSKVLPGKKGFRVFQDFFDMWVVFGVVHYAVFAAFEGWEKDL